MAADHGEAVPPHLLAYDSVEVRKVRGPRMDGRNVHHSPCDGLLCPCFQEGSAVRAHNHYSMLQWFARQAPDLVRQALDEASVSARTEATDGE